MSMSTSLRTVAEAEPGPASEPQGVPGDPAGPELPDRQRAALRELLRLVADRAAAEDDANQSRVANDAKVDTEYAKTRQGLVEKYQSLDREARSNDEQLRRMIIDDAMVGESKAKADFAASSRRIASEFDSLRESAKNEYNRARGDAASQLDAGNRKAATEHTQALQPLSDALEVSDGFRARLATVAAEYGKFKLVPDLPGPVRESYSKFTDPVDELFKRLGRMEPTIRILEGLIIPKTMKGAREAWVFIVPLLVCVGIAIVLEMPAAGIGIAGLALTGLAVGGLLRTWLVQLSKTQLQRLYNPLVQSLADADGLTAYCRAQAEARSAEERKRLATRHEEDMKRAKESHVRAIDIGETKRDERIRQINEIYAQRMVDVQTAQAREMSEAVESHRRRMAEIQTESERNLVKLDEHYKSFKEQVRTRFETKWTALAARWRDGMERVSSELSAARRTVDEIGPTWDDPSWPDRPLPRLVPPVIRMGTVAVELAALERGVSSDPRLMDGIAREFELPALRPFPAAANLLIETPTEGRTAAMAVLQASMFRILTSLPPGMVRFTIVDPIGIGRNFGAFMHLADFDPALVTNQVWTDPRQIEERLAELEAHMETVTQKYLRNEYPSIEAYNAVAGEVAEPYRVLVVADFPTKLDEKAAGRLAAIAAGGVPCGVLTLVAVDTSKTMPSGFGLNDLRPHCAI